MAEANTRELSQADPEKQARAQKARKPLMETSMQRAAAGEYRWALTLFPTHAHAAEAGMSLGRYEDFYYAACLHRRADPVTAWRASRTRSSAWPSGWRARRRSTSRRRAPTSRSNVAGRTFIPCVGEHNMPDGEFFTGPVEDSVEGEVTLLVPRHLRRARGLRASGCASRAARWWTPRPSAARTS